MRDGGAFLFKGKQVILSQSKFGYFRMGKRQIKGKMNGFRKLGRKGNGWGGERESYLACSSWLKSNELVTSLFVFFF